MRSRRSRLLVLTVLAVLLVSLGTTLTAAMNVPPSNAGIASIEIDAAVTVEAAVALHPQNLPRRGGGHDTLSATITFPAGVPPEAGGALISGVTMSLPDGTQTISAQAGDHPNQFVFTREDVLDLVGPVNGDVTVVVSGNVGIATFSEEVDMKINGPI